MDSAEAGLDGTGDFAALDHAKADDSALESLRVAQGDVLLPGERTLMKVHLDDADPAMGQGELRDAYNSGRRPGCGGWFHGRPSRDRCANSLKERTRGQRWALQCSITV